MKQGFYFLLLLGFSLLGRLPAQPLHSKPEQALFFNNKLEKRVLNKKSKSNIDEKLGLLLAPSSGSTEHDIQFIKLSLINFYRSQKNIRINSGKLKKNALEIQKAINSYFFKRYDDYSDFKSMFKAGTYNDLNGAALYALVLEHYNIAYEIKMRSGKIFPVAISETESFEFSIPKGQKRQFSDAFMRQFVEFLWDIKMISEQEYREGNTVKLFKRYYQPDEKNLGFEELSAMLYYKKALKAYKRSDYSGAIDAAEKAGFLPTLCLCPMIDLPFQYKQKYYHSFSPVVQPA